MHACNTLPTRPAPMLSGWLNATGPRGPGPQRYQIHRLHSLAASRNACWMTNLRCPRSCQTSWHRRHPRLSSLRRNTVPCRCQSYVQFCSVGGSRVCLYRCRFHGSPAGILRRLLNSHLRSRPSSICRVPFVHRLRGSGRFRLPSIDISSHVSSVVVDRGL